MRLESFLAQSGLSSRRRVSNILEAGRVKVNDEVVRIPSYPIFPDRDKVTVDGRPVTVSQKKLYFMINKPKGVITTAKDTHGRKTVMDFFKDIRARLYPVGRLDQDTTGLLLVTNDGALTNRLTHPRYGVRKVYDALLDHEISQSQTARLESGVVIEGRRTARCRMKILSTRGGRSKVEVMLHEGRKRQIREMFETIGFRVVHLHRKRYGPLILHGLRTGARRELDESEIAALRQVAAEEQGTFHNRGIRRHQLRRPHEFGSPEQRSVPDDSERS